MRTKIMTIGLTLAAIALATGAKAGFLTDTLDGSYYFPDQSTVALAAGSQVVNPTASFFFPTGTPNTTVSVSDTNILETFDGGGIYNSATFSGAVITDLTASNITGVTLDAATNLPGFTLADVSFTTDSISINIQGFSVPSADDVISLDVTFAGAPDVPEPASLALLGAGFAGLGFVRRRKRA